MILTPDFLCRVFVEPKKDQNENKAKRRQHNCSTHCRGRGSDGHQDHAPHVLLNLHQVIIRRNVHVLQVAAAGGKCAAPGVSQTGGRGSASG